MSHVANGHHVTQFGPLSPVSQYGLPRTHKFVRRNITMPNYVAVRNCSYLYLTIFSNEFGNLGCNDLAEASAIKYTEMPNPFLQPVQALCGID